MDIIVTLKQVPETDKVTMDPDTGTIIRTGTGNIINPLDLYAIEAALRLKERAGAEAKAEADVASSAAAGSSAGAMVTVITMGPPDAERALREALAMGCDRAVLLTDRAFAGSDTWATSRVLAAAIRKLCPQKPCDLIITGERATDGDTSQVGPGIAAWLGIPVLTYVSSLEIEERAEGRYTRIRRLTEEGYQRIEARLPCLVTVVKEIASPRLPTLRGKKAARTAEIIRWGAADLGLNPEETGLAGSPTRVTKIFHPRVARDGTRLIARDEEGIEKAISAILTVLEEKGLLSPGPNVGSDALAGKAARAQADSFPAGTFPKSVSQKPVSMPPARSESPGRELWIIAEMREGRVHPISFELLARGRLLADRLGVPLAAIVPVPSFISEDADSLIAHGADIVLALEDTAFSPFICERWSRAISTLARTRKPDIILAAATSTGRTLMPHLAVMLSTGLTADCTELAIEEGTELLLQTRPAIGGNIMATIKTPRHKPQMATVRPHSMRPLAPDPARCGTVLRLPRSLLEPGSKPESILQAEPESSAVSILSLERDVKDFQNLEAARIVVSGGKGLRKAEHFRHVRALAEALGGAVGASREAVDRGWISYPHQVGLSGKTISPELYICAGISGAIQHLAGIRTAKTIISINSDPDAPIHAVADLALIGDLFELLPRLTRAIEEKRGRP